MRVSKQATVAWGVVQLGVALGAQWMERSVLDAGLAGAVVRVGRGARRVPARHAGAVGRASATRSSGMIAGLVVMTAVWWGTPMAFTWYVLIGAVTTCVAWRSCSTRGSRRRPA